MVKPLSKRREAELRAAFRIMGRAFAELLIRGEQGARGTTDWQVAMEMVDRLQQRHLSPADWERFTFTTGWLSTDMAAELGEGAPRPPAVRAAAKKPALH